MINVAFFLGNRNIASRDMTEADQYNPGVGGTEAICIQMATYLNRRNNDIHTILLTEENASFPKDVQYINVSSFNSAIKYVEANHIDFFVVDTRLLNFSILNTFRNVTFIGWANCDIEEENWDLFNNCKNLKRIVCVGVCEKEKLRNHSIYKKCIVIYPPVPTDMLHKIKTVPRNERGRNVVYIGSLIPCKGLGYIAKCWADVLEKAPDSQLYIIGTGKLYDEHGQMGKWGIAEKTFEDELMEFFAPNGHDILPSVHFLGILGKEKYQILANAKVGVPNPSGQTETFCISAAEMQMMGCAVTTIHGEGFIDSVANKKNLYNSVEQLPQYIEYLLQENDNDDCEFTMAYLDRFSPQNVSIGWEMLLRSLITNK